MSVPFLRGAATTLARARTIPTLSLRRTALVVVLAVGFVFAQGVSLVLLLPAASLVGDTGAARPDSSVWAMIDWILSTLRVPNEMLPLFLTVIGFVVLAQVIQYVYTYVSIRAANQVGAGLRHAAFAAFLRADLRFHRVHRSGELLNTLNQDTNRAVGVIQAITELLVRSLTLSLYMGALLLLSWEMALVALVTLLAVTMGSQFWVAGAWRSGQRNAELQESLQALSVERLHGLRDVKLAHRESLDSELVRGIAGEIAVVDTMMATRAHKIRAILEPVVVGVGLGVVYLGTTFFDMSLAELAVFLFTLLRIVPEARSLNTARYHLGTYKRRLVHVMDITAEARRHEEPSEGPPPIFQAEGPALEWRGVSLGFRRDRDVLADLTLAIAPGETTAIVGASGSGKSTMLALLVRLLEPDQGEVLVAGRPVAELGLAHLRTSVALVTQDASIFYGTVADTVRLARPDATDKQVDAALADANAAEFVRELPEGAATMIGERGSTLSAGQAQRLALARALVSNPEVLLLDEVTSAQDPISDRAIQDAVINAHGTRTVVIVSHRLSSVKGVDRVVVLEHGRIVEDGHPDELLSKGGLFSEYVRLQAGTGSGPDSGIEENVPR